MALTVAIYRLLSWQDITFDIPLLGDPVPGLMPFQLEKVRESNVAVARFGINAGSYSTTATGTEIKVEVDGARWFGGYIRTRERVRQGTLFGANFECQDYNSLLDRVVVPGYTIHAGDTDSTEIETLRSTYLAGYGVTAGTISTVQASMPEDIVLKGTFRQCLETIAAHAGGAFFHIDASKNLHYVGTTGGYSISGADNLSDDLSVAFSYPYADLTERVDETRRINQVYVVGDGIEGWYPDPVTGNYQTIVYDSNVTTQDGLDALGAAIVDDFGAALTEYSLRCWEDVFWTQGETVVRHADFIGGSGVSLFARRVLMMCRSADGEEREYVIEFGDHTVDSDHLGGSPGGGGGERGPIFGSGDPTDIEPDDVAAPGTERYASREDHRHGIVCAAPVSISAGANAEGSATSFARSDHVHQHPAALGTDLHHAQSHVLATTGALGPDHTVSGLSDGLFLRASGATTAAFAAIQAGDLPGSFAGFANPSAQVGLSAVNGSATTAMRSDAAPALSEAIVPTWTARHTWNDGSDRAYVDEDGSAWFTGGVAIGPTTVNATTLLRVQDLTASFSGADYYGINTYVVKTAGASTVADDFNGYWSQVQLNQAGGTIGNMYAALMQARIDQGNVGSSGTSKNLTGILFTADLNGGKVWGNAYGQRMSLDQEAGNEVTGDAIALVARGDFDGTVGGSAYLLKLEGVSNADYGVYETGAAENILIAPTGIGAFSTSAQLHVDQSSASGGIPVAIFDQGHAGQDLLVVRRNGSDVDINVLRVDVTGQPLLWWDESESRLIWDEDLGLSAGDLHFASGLGVVHADGVTDGQVLVANGTQYVPGDLSDMLGGDATFVTLTGSTTLANERRLTSGNGLAALADGGAGSTVTVALGTPSTLTVATANGLTATSHTHEVTSSSNPGAAASLLATDASGYLTLEDMYLDEYLWHTGDADTWLRFEADAVTVQAGGWTALGIVEGAADYVSVGSVSRDSAFSASLYAMDGNIGVSQDGDAGGFQAFTYGDTATGYPLVRLRRGRNTRASPSAVQDGDVLGRVGAGGYNGSAFSSESSGHIQVEATETWNAAAYGTLMRLRVTPNGSVTYRDALILMNNGIGRFQYGVRTIYSENNVSSPPTDAQLDTAFGSPATAGEGFLALVDDNDANTDGWLVAALGGSWWYTALTKAV